MNSSSSTALNTTRTSDNSTSDFFTSFLGYLGIAEAVITPFAIVGNLVIIVTVLSSKSLRREFRPLLIVSMAFSDLIIATLFCPERAHLGLSQEIIYSCNFQLLLFFFEEFIQHFVSIWGVLSVNTTYLLNLCSHRLPPMSAWRKRLLFGGLLALPWLIMAIFMPVATKYEGKYRGGDSYCIFIMNATIANVLCLVTYFIPISVALIECIVMTVMFLRKQSPDRAESPWAYIGATLVMLILLPEFLYNMIIVHLSRYRYQSIVFMGVSTVLADTKCAVLPFIWFVSPRIRQAFTELYRRSICQPIEPEPESDTTVTYKNIDTQDQY